MHRYKIQFNRGTRLDEAFFVNANSPVEATKQCIARFKITFSQVTEICEVFDLETIKNECPQAFFTDEEFKAYQG